MCQVAVGQLLGGDNRSIIKTISQKWPLSLIWVNKKNHWVSKLDHMADDP